MWVFTAGRGPGDRQHQRISQMQNTLKLHESQLKDAEVRANEVSTIHTSYRNNTRKLTKKRNIM